MKTAEQIAEKLWEKYRSFRWDERGRDCEDIITKKDFIEALKEYGEAVRQRAAGVCRELRFTEQGPSTEAKHQRMLCAAAIESMELP